MAPVALDTDYANVALSMILCAGIVNTSVYSLGKTRRIVLYLKFECCRMLCSLDCNWKHINYCSGVGKENANYDTFYIYQRRTNNIKRMNC